MMKMNRIIWVAMISSICFFACKSDKPEVILEEKIKDPVLVELAGENYDELIRIPIKSDGTLDTINAPRIEFDHLSYNFGDVKKGATVRHKFPFKNIGQKDLYIIETNTSCGCTVSEHDKEAINPQGNSHIEVSFDSTERTLGDKKKTIKVTSNTFPNTTELTILANVIE